YIEFKLDALLRGDTKSRYEGYAIARQWGWMSINDVRRYENMDEVEGGDQYMVPLNMRPHDEPADEQSSDILQASFISQMIKREYNGLKSKIGAEDLSEWFEGFSGKTRQDLFTLGLNRDQVDSFISSALANTDKIDDWTTYRSNELMTLIRGQK
ncbi:MAG: phage portal protein, partial [Herbaspirillum sp.]|nr:phage portal protein [Herbaspirillum sp.]